MMLPLSSPTPPTPPTTTATTSTPGAMFLCEGEGLISGSSGEHTIEYGLRVNEIFIRVEHTVTTEAWSNTFSREFVEELSLQAGSYKELSVFFRMLEKAIANTDPRAAIAVHFYTFAELEKLQRGGISKLKQSLGHASRQLETRRYLIITYATDYDRVQYPLPLIYEGEPDPKALIQKIKALQESNLRRHTATRQHSPPPFSSQGSDTSNYSHAHDNDYISARTDNPHHGQHHRQQQQQQQQRHHSDSSQATTPTATPPIPTEAAQQRTQHTQHTHHTQPERSNLERQRAAIDVDTAVSSDVESVNFLRERATSPFTVDSDGGRAKPQHAAAARQRGGPRTSTPQLSQQQQQQGDDDEEEAQHNESMAALEQALAHVTSENELLRSDNRVLADAVHQLRREHRELQQQQHTEKEDGAESGKRNGHNDSSRDVQLLKTIIANMEQDMLQQKTKFQQALQKRVAQVDSLEAELAAVRMSERNLRLKCRHLTSEVASHVRAAAARQSRRQRSASPVVAHTPASPRNISTTSHGSPYSTGPARNHATSTRTHTRQPRLEGAHGRRSRSASPSTAGSDRQQRVGSVRGGGGGRSRPRQRSKSNGRSPMDRRTSNEATRRDSRTRVDRQPSPSPRLRRSRSSSPARRFDPTAYVRAREEKLRAAKMKREGQLFGSRSRGRSLSPSVRTPHGLSPTLLGSPSSRSADRGAHRRGRTPSASDMTGERGRRGSLSNSSRRGKSATSSTQTGMRARSASPFRHRGQKDINISPNGRARQPQQRYSDALASPSQRKKVLMAKVADDFDRRRKVTAEARKKSSHGRKKRQAKRTSHSRRSEHEHRDSPGVVAGIDFDFDVDADIREPSFPSPQRHSPRRQAKQSMRGSRHSTTQLDTSGDLSLANTSVTTDDINASRGGYFEEIDARLDALREYLDMDA